MRAGRFDGARRILIAEDRATRPGLDDIHGWLGRYQLALYLHRIEEAVEIGEWILDQTREFEFINRLSVAFFSASDLLAVGSSGEKYLRQTGSRLSRFEARHPRSPWSYFLNPFRRSGSGDDRIKNLSKYAGRKRYAWMRRDVGMRLLKDSRFSAAIREFESVRDWSRPGDWLAECHIAEARLGQGENRQMVAAFRRAERIAPPEKINEVRAWHGQMLLWSGCYSRALEVLETVPDDGSSPYALCWRGGALLMLGRPTEALSILDRMLAHAPHDYEARVWRCETLRNLGRYDEALCDADAAVSIRADDYTRIVRALVCNELGRFDQMRREYALLSPKILQYFPRRTSKTSSDLQIVSDMEGFLRYSRGVRNWDDGMFAVQTFGRRPTGRRPAAPLTGQGAFVGLGARR